jgi:uncharacterized membrane protein YoaT (DUF817 family)
MSTLDFLKNYGYIIGYIIFLIVYAVFVLAAFYHTWEYGYAGDASKAVMFAYAGACVMVVIITFILLFSY